MVIRTLVEAHVFMPSGYEGKLSSVVENIIREKRKQERNNYEFVICKSPEVTVSSQHVYVMYRINKSNYESYFDAVNWQPVIKHNDEKHIKSKSRFLIFEDDTVVLEDAKPTLSKNVFKNILEQLLIGEITERVREIKIEFVVGKEDIEQFLENCASITYIRFSDLYAPNPYNFGEKINNGRDLIKNWKCGKITIESKDGSVNVGANEISGMIGMVQEGVGRVKIKGTNAQEEKSQFETTQKMFKSETVDIKNDTDFLQRAKKFVGSIKKIGKVRD